MKLARRGFVALLICVSLIGGNMVATAFPQKEKGVKIDFKEFTLKNGLRVIAAEDHTAPVVALCITYNAGSRNEKEGKTGYAHLFEHMMFKGSENVGSGEHFVLISNVGGEMNGTTTEDRTNYFEEVPANQLDMVLFLESDRMRSLAITKENLDNQRNAVQEERRLGVDNQPYGESEEKMQNLLYDNFAYKHTTIGSMDDLNRATVEDVAAFFKTYYAPNNAVLSLVGDFNTNEALAKIKKYFENIPRQPAPPPVDMTEPQQTAERRATVEDKLAKVPELAIAYKAVPGNTPDYYALVVLSAALQSGQSSRLYQKLVKDSQVAQSASGYVSEKRGPGAFYTTVLLNPRHKPEEAEKLVYEEIDKLKKEPVADWELEKAKNFTKRQLIASVQSSLFAAVLLGQYTVFYNEPNLVNTRLDKIAAVTKEDVQRVANKYLNETNRTVVITLPAGGGPSAASAQRQGGAK